MNSNYSCVDWCTETISECTRLYNQYTETKKQERADGIDRSEKREEIKKVYEFYCQKYGYEMGCKIKQVVHKQKEESQSRDSKMCSYIALSILTLGFLPLVEISQEYYSEKVEKKSNISFFSHLENSVKKVKYYIQDAKSMRKNYKDNEKRIELSEKELGENYFYLRFITQVKIWLPPMK